MSRFLFTGLRKDLQQRFKASYDKSKDSFREIYESAKKEATPAEFVNFIVHTATIVSALHFIGAYVCHVSSCVGPSMLPTFRETGDLVLVDRFMRHIIKRVYSKGDIVIAWAPYDPEKLVCKRIGGCAGDTVKREYKIGNRTIRSDVIVPPGHVWLLGDNPDNSKDSRHYGPVPEQLISGRVVAKLWWPPQKYA